jgi:hypothetical protein
MIPIVAGNHLEFKRWVANTRLRNRTNGARHITSVDQIMGLDCAAVLLIGTYRNNTELMVGLRTQEYLGRIHLVEVKQ